MSHASSALRAGGACAGGSRRGPASGGPRACAAGSTAGSSAYQCARTCGRRAKRWRRCRRVPRQRTASAKRLPLAPGVQQAPGCMSRPEAVRQSCHCGEGAATPAGLTCDTWAFTKLRGCCRRAALHGCKDDYEQSPFTYELSAPDITATSPEAPDLCAVTMVAKAANCSCLYMHKPV